MFKEMKKRIKNEKGLTLIELLAVIVILAIIAAIAIPAIGNIISNSRDKAVLSDAANLLSGAKIAITDNSCGAGAADTGIITCNNTALAGYFEGVLASTDTVVYNPSTKVYTINYTKLGTIKNNTKFNVAAVTGGDPGFTGGTSQSITEASLKKAMSQ